MPTDEAAQDPRLLAFLEKSQRDAARNSFFVGALLNPTFHWHFTQGQQALEQELYLPGVSALLNGIEASLRMTMSELGGGDLERLELSNYQLLSNPLLRQCRDAGLPVEALSFPDEKDFKGQLDTKTSVKVVALRHDICHGNILDFIEILEGEEPIQILTPECLRPTAALLLGLSLRWARDLGEFRSGVGLRPKLELPPVPENALEEWLRKVET
ncbi:MAG: hypothetical protein U1C74_10740 [Phenylobacterium sp.]|nr:hypothetical protein [Phenylobacterium sp.]